MVKREMSTKINNIDLIMADRHVFATITSLYRMNRDGKRWHNFIFCIVLNRSDSRRFVHEYLC